MHYVFQVCVLFVVHCVLPVCFMRLRLGGIVDQIGAYFNMLFYRGLGWCNWEIVSCRTCVRAVRLVRWNYQQRVSVLCSFPFRLVVSFPFALWEHMFLLPFGYVRDF